MKQIELPEEKIQQLAEKYAMEGAEKAIREYYTGYNSPYMKMMEEHLKAIAPNPRFDLPDLTAAINKALSDRIMDMANEVVAKTYVKLFNRIFTPNEYNQVTATMLFQQFGDYIKDREGDDFDSDALEFETGKDYFGTELRYLKFKYQSEVEFDLTIWGRGQTEKGEKLYALIYPDFDEAGKAGLDDDGIRQAMEQNRKDLNAMVAAYEQITGIRIYNEEFEKTPKRSIKRFLYKDEEI